MLKDHFLPPNTRGDYLTSNDISPDEWETVKLSYEIMRTIQNHRIETGTQGDRPLLNSEEEFVEWLESKRLLERVVVRPALPLSNYPSASLPDALGDHVGTYHVPTQRDVSFGYGIYTMETDTQHVATYGVIGQAACAGDQLERAEQMPEDIQKKVVSEVKRSLVDSANAHAGGEYINRRMHCKVANVCDFGGRSTCTTILEKTLPQYAIDYAERVRYKHTIGLHDSDEIQSLGAKILTTYHKYMNEHSDTRVELNTATLYTAISNVIYGGDMLKAHRNLSLTYSINGLNMPEEWQQFNGSTKEFMSLHEIARSVRSGVEAYVQLADELYGGSMQKVYINFSAVCSMTGLNMPEGWQQFHGSTKEFAVLQETARSAQPGVEGYLQLADELYGGDMTRAYINLSAVCNMTGRSMPEGWRVFYGSTKEFIALQDIASDAQPGVEAYVQLADELYGGSMAKTFRNLSAVCNMTGLSMPEGWQQFHGSTKELCIIKDIIEHNKHNAYATITQHYNGSVPKTRINIHAICNMYNLPRPLDMD